MKAGFLGPLVFIILLWHQAGETKVRNIRSIVHAMKVDVVIKRVNSNKSCLVAFTKVCDAYVTVDRVGQADEENENSAE